MSLRNSSGLHVPEPAARPGCAPDFPSILSIDQPDPSSPPAMDADPQSIHGLAYGLVRVLDDDGLATGGWKPSLEPKLMITGLRAMMTTRVYDNRMSRAQRQGKTSFYMKSTGEEAVSVAAALALHPQDMCFPSYRQQGLLITRRWPLIDMMNQVFSNVGDRLKGRQMPVFYSSREAGFFSISGNLATQYSQAVGWAMAAAADRDPRIAAAWLGDGSTAESDFHHALTFASVYQAPIVLNIVNNQWAISSFSGIAGAERTTFAARGIGYGIPSIRCDGNDFLAVYAVTEWAARRAREGFGPTVIELFTYRAASHSTSDDPTKYRPNDEPDKWPLGDPIERLRQHLVKLGHWDDARHAELADAVEQEVRNAAEESEALGTLKSGTRPPTSSMFDDVYRDMPPHLTAQRAQAGF